MAKGKLLRHAKTGFYDYQFNWVNERGFSVGFNSVWAPNKREAVKLAKKMEKKAGWHWYNGKEYVAVKEQVTTGGHCYYFDGMYVDPKSMYRATLEQSRAMDRLSWMMTC